jgi:hypothetical protein
MSMLSSAFDSLRPKSPPGAKVGLSVAEEEPLTGKEATETCTLKIEGMTCGACVEVRGLVKQAMATR